MPRVIRRRTSSASNRQGNLLSAAAAGRSSRPPSASVNRCARRISNGPALPRWTRISSSRWDRRSRFIRRPPFRCWRPIGERRTSSSTEGRPRTTITRRSRFAWTGTFLRSFPPPLKRLSPSSDGTLVESFLVVLLAVLFVGDERVLTRRDLSFPAVPRGGLRLFGVAHREGGQQFFEVAAFARRAGQAFVAGPHEHLEFMAAGPAVVIVEGHAYCCFDFFAASSFFSFKRAPRRMLPIA